MRSNQYLTIEALFKPLCRYGNYDGTKNPRTCRKRTRPNRSPGNPKSYGNLFIKITLEIFPTSIEVISNWFDRFGISTVRSQQLRIKSVIARSMLSDQNIQIAISEDQMV